MTTAVAILTALDRIHPHLLPESSLLMDVNVQLSRPIGFTDLRDNLRLLEKRQFVVSIEPDALLSSGELKWRITDTGRANIPK